MRDATLATEVDTLQFIFVKEQIDRFFRLILNWYAPYRLSQNFLGTETLQ